MKTKSPELTTIQAAELLGCTPKTIAQHCRAGTLPARRVGRDWLIEAAAVKRFRLGKPGRPKLQL